MRPNAGKLDNPKPSAKNRYFKSLNPWYVPYSCRTKKEKRAASKLKESSSPNLADEDDVLIFESRFESGNLKKAIQVDKSEYELVLKPDHNTKNYT